ASGASFAQGLSTSTIVTPPLKFTVQLSNSSPTQVVNSATLAASGSDTTSPPVTTNTGSPSLTLTKSNSPDSTTVLNPGDPITYTLVAENVGSGDATGVVITDSIPANTDFVSCTASCSTSGI